MIKYTLVKMKVIWQCMFAPRLHKIYRDGPIHSMYEPEGLHRWCDKIITSTNTLVNIALYTAPFICMYVMRRGLLSIDETRFLMRTFGGLSCLFAACFFLRGFARANDPRFLAFVRALTTPPTDYLPLLQALRRYDFDFSHWPVTYRVDPTTAIVPWYQRGPFRQSVNDDLPNYQRRLIQILAFISTHTFGLRLIYPGSVGLVRHLLSSALFEGRTYLIENLDGKRTKILTSDCNSIDTMFVDNRTTNPVKGKTLIICCEGNSGFYEIGIMSTPAKAGYSALGWNHPGFGGSTGRPYPDQEQNAMDAVILYAVHQLGFAPENIVLYGWSIGGYPATWAAGRYPVQGLILDATFDDLLPLAENHMPSSWNRLVREVIRCYVDLNLVDLIREYSGPVQLIRRTDDEIICLRQGQLASNRGNMLLVGLVESRHADLPPRVRDQLRELVSLNATQRESLAQSTVSDSQQRALRLINAYMRDYKSSHCTPLPQEYFERAMQALDRVRKMK